MSSGGVCVFSRLSFRGLGLGLEGAGLGLGLGLSTAGLGLGLEGAGLGLGLGTLVLTTRLLSTDLSQVSYDGRKRWKIVESSKW